MRDYEINYLHKKLLNLKEESENKLKIYEKYGFNDSIKDNVQELSSYDNHPGDLGSETFEKEKYFSLKKQQTEFIADISEALSKLDNDKYGICDFCGNNITFERLDAFPTAKLCIQCQKERMLNLEKLDYDRPIEESILFPPFGRTFTDETDNNSYDGEDAWQDVEKYGSSSGPQDISVNRLINYKNAFLDSDDKQGIVEEIEEIDNDGRDGFNNI